MKQHIVNISKYIVILLLAVAAACSDEIKAPGGAVVEEGLPATLSFEVDLLDRAQVSRAQVPENLVTSLWIGVFNETTGEIKGRFAVEDINDETPGRSGGASPLRPPRERRAWWVWRTMSTASR